MPKLYDGWFDDQIAKQASAAVSRAISAGKVSKVRCKTEIQSICGPNLKLYDWLSLTSVFYS